MSYIDLEQLKSKMWQLKKEHVILLLDKSIYIALLVLGIYFIHEGEVFQRYQIGRTDYYQYNEAMCEFPTIITKVFLAPTNGSMGIDFNLLLSKGPKSALLLNGSPHTILTNGKNHIKGTELEVDLQVQSYDDSLGSVIYNKISPLNFNTLGGWWSIIYSVTNASQWSESKVMIALSTENNSLSCQGRKDGEVHHVFTKFGERKVVRVEPQKFLYLNDKTPCREKPFLDEVLTLLHKDVLENPGRHCKFPSMCEPWLMSEEVNKLPACINQTGIEYMTDLFNSVPKKPCTKLSYHTKSKGPWPAKLNNAVFSVFLGDPYEIIVNEEYYLFDLISVIGAIGGTMGLFIGFSFKDFTRGFEGFLMRVWEKVNQLTNTKQSVEVDGKFEKNDNLTWKANDNNQDMDEEIGGMTKAELKAQQKEWETRMDKLQAELKQLLIKYDEKFIEMDRRLITSFGKEPTKFWG